MFAGRGGGCMADQDTTGAPAERDALIDWLFRTSREMMFVVAPDATIRLVNPAWTAATGWREDELIGRKLAEIVHPEDLGVYGREAPRISGDSSVDNLARLRARSGEWRWFEHRSQRTSDGCTIGTMRPSSASPAQAAE